MDGPVASRKRSGDRKGPSALRVILFLLAGVAFLITLVVGAGFLFFLTARDAPVTDADRGVLVTAERVAGFMDDFEPAPGAETVSKSLYIDGSCDVEYEYQDPNDEESIFLACTVTVERKKSDAIVTYGAEKYGIALGLKIQGDEIEQVEADHLLQWGDQSSCTILKYEGTPVGNVLVARKGRKVFALTLSGVYFEDAGSFQALVLPSLERLETYVP